MHLKKTTIGLLVTLASIHLHANPPSQHPPEEISADKAPMFVAIGSDDNGVAVPASQGGMAWFLDLMQQKRNPAGNGNPATFDGLPITATFFNTCSYLDQASGEQVQNQWRRALNEGHEVGNHTVDHLWGADKQDKLFWQAQISDCEARLEAPYLPGDPIRGIGANTSGFRAPFLMYNRDTFTSLIEAGLRYDASIIEGLQPDQDGSNYLWPYTLDQGSPGNELRAAWGLNPDIGKHEGLWEIPVYTLIVPPDEALPQYGIEYSLRDKMKQLYSWFGGKMTSIDYNMFYLFKLNKQEVLAILKYSFDLRINGNRAPMTFGLHSDMYVDNQPGAPENITRQEMREAVSEFIDYVLEHPEVRIISYNKLVDWLEQPEPLNNPHCQMPNWQQGVDYQTGDYVVYNEQVWQAKWWSHNTPPLEKNWSEWQPVRQCLSE